MEEPMPNLSVHGLWPRFTEVLLKSGNCQEAENPCWKEPGAGCGGWQRSEGAAAQQNSRDGRGGR